MIEPPRGGRSVPYKYYEESESYKKFQESLSHKVEEQKKRDSTEQMETTGPMVKGMDKI